MNTSIQIQDDHAAFQTRSQSLDSDDPVKDYHQAIRNLLPPEIAMIQSGQPIPERELFRAKITATRDLWDLLTPDEKIPFYYGFK